MPLPRLPLTMFAYLGLESATVPAGDVRDPDRTIPRSTIIGISVAALLYVLGTLVVMGVVPHEQLVNSIALYEGRAESDLGLTGTANQGRPRRYIRLRAEYFRGQRHPGGMRILLGRRLGLPIRQYESETQGGLFVLWYRAG